MAPTIRAGDAVVTLSQPFGAPSVGSVLLVESEGRRLLHRLARHEEGSLWMKGDASVSGDSRSHSNFVSLPGVAGNCAVHRRASGQREYLQRSWRVCGAGAEVHLRRRCTGSLAARRLCAVERPTLCMQRHTRRVSWKLCPAHTSNAVCGPAPASRKCRHSCPGTRSSASDHDPMPVGGREWGLERGERSLHRRVERSER